MKKLLILTASLLALGLASCTAEAPEDDESSEEASSSLVGESSSTGGYDWNVIDEKTNLVIMAWDRYCETEGATAETDLTSLGTAHTDALVAAYIKTLPADTDVRIGVKHSSIYANGDLCVAANDGSVDIVLGTANAFGSSNGATNIKDKKALAADWNAYLATATGRQAALMTHNEKAIAAYNLFTGTEYVIPEESSSEIISSSEETSSSEESSIVLNPVTYDYNVVNEQTNVILSVWDAQSETKTDDVYGKSFTNAFVEGFIGRLPVDTTIRVGVLHYSASTKVGDYGAYVNGLLEAGTKVDVLLGTGGNIDTDTSGGATGGNVTTVIAKSALKDTMALAKTGRQAALMNADAGSVALYDYLVTTPYTPAA